MSKLGDVLSKLVELKHITEGACLRAEHPAAWRFFVIFFFEKITILLPLDYTSLVFRAM